MPESPMRPYRQPPWWLSLAHEDHDDDTAVCVRCMAEREADYRDQAADLQRRIDKAFPFLTAIRYAPYLKGKDAERWATEAQAALTTPNDQERKRPCRRSCADKGGPGCDCRPSQNDPQAQS